MSQELQQVIQHNFGSQSPSLQEDEAKAQLQFKQTLTLKDNFAQNQKVTVRNFEENFEES